MVGTWRPVYSQVQITENVLELVHFEDLPLGGEWTTRRRTITQADLSAFVGFSGDYNPLYMDAEHARGGPFGEPVVPGTLVAAVATGLGAIDVPVPATVGMVGMTWRFLRPVRPGDTIRSRWRLNRKRPVDNPRWGLAVWQVEVENQHGETVAAADVTRLVSRREQPVEAARASKSRRRRRRAAAEAAGADAAANHALPSKPAPGPLREPMFIPASEPAPAQPEPGRAQPEPAPAQPEPARAQPEPAQPEPEPAHEPVAEEKPRRRRRAGGRPKPAIPAALEPGPAASAGMEPPQADTADPGPEPWRGRRFRGGPEQGELALQTFGVPENGSSAGGLAGVLRRLRGD